MKPSGTDNLKLHSLTMTRTSQHQLEIESGIHAMETNKSWIQFDQVEPSKSGKTKRWEVNVAGGCGPILGHVQWFGRWRCYAFYPDGKTVFERACLRDIANFCEEETNKHRMVLKSNEHV